MLLGISPTSLGVYMGFASQRVSLPERTIRNREYQVRHARRLARVGNSIALWETQGIWITLQCRVADHLMNSPE